MVEVGACLESGVRRGLVEAEKLGVDRGGGACFWCNCESKYLKNAFFGRFGHAVLKRLLSKYSNK